MATVGITEFAANSLGDVVYAQLPAVGDTVTAGESCGELESTKSVSDLFAPVTGEVVEANQDVVDDPALVNTAPLRGRLAVQGEDHGRAGRPAVGRRLHGLHRRLTPPLPRKSRKNSCLC
ncbi:hypothetical protein GCM10020000_24350 [Streptomyces olivoverticillatus]